MFLLAAVLEFFASLLFEILFEVGCFGTGSLLIWVFSAGRIRVGAAGRGEAWATLVGVVFWVVAGAAVYLAVLK